MRRPSACLKGGIPSIEINGWRGPHPVLGRTVQPGSSNLARSAGPVVLTRLVTPRQAGMAESKAQSKIEERRLGRRLCAWLSLAQRRIPANTTGIPRLPPFARRTTTNRGRPCGAHPAMSSRIGDLCEAVRGLPCAVPVLSLDPLFDRLTRIRLVPVQAHTPARDKDEVALAAPGLTRGQLQPGRAALRACSQGLRLRALKPKPCGLHQGP